MNKAIEITFPFESRIKVIKLVGFKVKSENKS